MKNLIPEEAIERKIYLIREHKVMLGKELANLYGVSAKRLNEQVKRNIKRFPDDFMFQLTKEEVLMLQIGTSGLRSQFATLDDVGKKDSSGGGGSEEYGVRSQQSTDKVIDRQMTLSYRRLEK